MNRFELVRMVLDHLGIESRRFSVQWVSAAEGIRFVQVITEFDGRIGEFGPLGRAESVPARRLRHRLLAAETALESRSLRMAFAKQAKQIKEGNTYGRFPSPEKLQEAVFAEIRLQEILLYLQEKERTVSELAGLADVTEAEIVKVVETLRKKNLWSGELAGAGTGD